MRNLFRADMRRIRRRKILYVGLVIFIFALIRGILLGLGETGTSAKGVIDGVHDALSSAFTALIITIPIFIAVFSNELSSKSMQCVLGRGLTRDKLILTKLLDAFVINAVFFAVASLLMILLMDDSIGASDVQRMNLHIYIWITFLRYFGYITFSALIMFALDSTTAGIISCVAFAILFRLVFVIIDLYVDVQLWEYTFDGFLDSAYLTIEAGGIGWQVLVALLYLVVSIAATIALFRRKEFEF